MPTGGLLGSQRKWGPWATGVLTFRSKGGLYFQIVTNIAVD